MNVSLSEVVDILRPRNLCPDYEFNSVADITPELLVRVGMVKAVAYDGDSTLYAHGRVELDETVRSAFEGIVSYLGRDKVCIISNTTKERMALLEQSLGVRVIRTRQKKPAREPFEAALSYFGTAPEETLMVGDRLMTDVAGANRVGFRTARVKPLHPASQPFGVRVARRFEDLVYAAYNTYGDCLDFFNFS